MRVPGLLLLSYLVISFQIEIFSARAATAVPDHPIVTVSECLDWGFDPHSLSCDTCSVLPLFEDECRHCCQAWRPDPVVNPESKREGFVGRYQMAVLSYSEGATDRNEELKNFLEEDREEVEVKKGRAHFTVVRAYW